MYPAKLSCNFVSALGASISSEASLRARRGRFVDVEAELDAVPHSITHCLVEASPDVPKSEARRAAAQIAKQSSARAKRSGRKEPRAKNS